MKPYYQDKYCTIYHGDCREILPSLPRVDLVLTDPPYGINAARTRNSQQWGWTDFEVNGWDKQRPDEETIRLCVKAGTYFIVWGGNYFLYLASPESKWLIWDKGQSDFSLADAELAICSWPGVIRRINYARSSALQDGKQHPTQKPVKVLTWSIMQSRSEPATILDPFMGSGTTLRAAKDLQRISIGIEIEERYCEIAANRLAQEVLELA